jgi:ATP synthase subunit C
MEAAWRAYSSWRTTLTLAKHGARRCKRYPKVKLLAAAIPSSREAGTMRASATITRTLFVGLAMIESTAIYCFVVSMILIFANPFWNHVIAQTAGK